MEIIKLRPAREFGVTTDRINGALTQLKTELAAMRNQDVDLMRRLININETLQTISGRQNKNRKSKRRTPSTNSMPTCAMATPESYPRGCYSPSHSLNTSFSGSLQSIEDDESSSIGDHSIFSDSDNEENLTQCSLNMIGLVQTTCRNSAIDVDCFDSEFPESKYEFILKTNVKLWKYSLKNHHI